MSINYVTDSSGAVVLDSVGLPVWSGEGLVPIPAVTGLTKLAATSLLAAAGFTVGTVSQSNSYSAIASVGAVQVQSPQAGYQAQSGTPVNLVLSQLSDEFDITTTVIAQYANSPIIGTLISNLAQYFDPTVNLETFYNAVWNIYTAQGFGLDIWGRILGISRYLTIAVTSSYFGFENDGLGDYTGFDQAPFYTGLADTQNYRLGDTAYLTLLLAKAFANICTTTIPVLNHLLTMLFGSTGNVYVLDTWSTTAMTMTVHFTFVPSAVQAAIVTQSGAFPHPTGVAPTVTHP